ncbi:MAG TPA: flagellar biosynthesis protein, partial [Rheinheimera sp.]|nr:flagellar biosynthesis protein [Rheinheimera sp.]
QPVAKAQKPQEEEELTLKPLTADDIEQIRQAAYDEGFAEGKDEGFSKGYGEGREQGQQDGFTQGQAEGKKQGLADGQEELNNKLTQL